MKIIGVIFIVVVFAMGLLGAFIGAVPDERLAEVVSQEVCENTLLALVKRPSSVEINSIDVKRIPLTLEEATERIDAKRHSATIKLTKMLYEEGGGKEWIYADFNYTDENSFGGSSRSRMFCRFLRTNPPEPGGIWSDDDIEFDVILFGDREGKLSDFFYLETRYPTGCRKTL